MKLKSKMSFKKLSVIVVLGCVLGCSNQELPEREAVAIAEDYASEHAIDLSEHEWKGAKRIVPLRKGERALWQMEWQRKNNNAQNRPLILHVHDDKRIERRY